MSDFTTQIMIGVTAAVAIGGVVIIVTSSQAAQGQRGRKFDLVFILGIAWLVAGIATLNYVVGGLGVICTVIGAIKRYKLFQRKPSHFDD